MKPSHTENPELLTTYGPWSLDVFLTMNASPPATLVLVTVESTMHGDEAREITNAIIHRLWDAGTAVPECHGHRLSWDRVLFLVAESEVARVRSLFASVPAHAETHAIHCWFTSAGSSPPQRRAAVRELEDQRERELPHQSPAAFS